MRVKVENAGEFGVVSTMPMTEIPMNAWTSAKNIRFLHNYAEPILGHTGIFTPAGEALHLTGLLVGSAWQMVYPTDVDADGKAETLHTYDGTAEVEITRTGGNYTGEGRWNSCVLNGVVICNNYGDCPQYWGGDTTVEAKDLYYSGTDTWDDIDGADTAYRAKVIRGFRNFLIAIGIKEIADYGGTPTETEYNYTIHWSNPADPGTIPDSWDYTDPATLSGRVDLADTPGVCVDGLPLRDIFVLYKEDSAWLMSYIGGQYQFRFDRLSGAHGLLGQDCVVDIGGAHICWGPKKVYMHDGSTIVDILSDKYESQFYKNLDSQYLDKCFLVHNSKYREVWFCFVPAGSTKVSAAHVYNYHYKTWSYRDLPSVNFIAPQQYISQDSDPASWPAAGDPRSWDFDTSLGWDFLSYDPTTNTLIGVGDRLYTVDTSSTFDGVAFECELERAWQRVADTGNWLMVHEFWPRFSGNGRVGVTVGAAIPSGGSVTWGTEQTFIVGTTLKTNMTIAGEYLAVRFRSTGASRWKISGYEYNIERIGVY